MLTSSYQGRRTVMMYFEEFLRRILEADEETISSLEQILKEYLPQTESQELLSCMLRNKS